MPSTTYTFRFSHSPSNAQSAAPSAHFTGRCVVWNAPRTSFSPRNFQSAQAIWPA
jgi:hypothetical protein